MIIINISFKIQFEYEDAVYKRIMLTEAIIDTQNREEIQTKKNLRKFHISQKVYF